MSSTVPSLRDITVKNAVKHFKSGTLTSAHLVRAYLSRIVEIDDEFNSVIETNPDALTAAQAQDAERAIGNIKSPLQGLPILLKDNIPTLDNTDTTCGSLALVGAKPKQEAAVVTALRKAGFVILGKANMAQWVGFRSTSGCSGWSARGGQTYGPFVRGSKASGSSSGSAVATALGLCFAAIGTETCYSIVSPAEKSGIVGYKPTKDLIPSEGIIYASKTQDTVGLLTRTVEDAVQITSLLIVNSGNHSTLRNLSIEKQQRFLNDLPKAIHSKETSLAGIRLGLPLDLIRSENPPECKLEAFGRALFRMETRGAKVVNNVIVQGWCEYEALTQEEKQVVLDTDMKLAIEDYLVNLETNPHNIKSLQHLIDFTKTHPEEEYPTRNAVGLERAQATDPNGDLYLRMVEKDRFFAECIQNTLDRYECDVLLIPTLSTTLQTFAAKAGSPVISVPIGIYPDKSPVEIDSKNGLIASAPGIPLSVFVFGRAYDDPSVLKIGHAIELAMRFPLNPASYRAPRGLSIDLNIRSDLREFSFVLDLVFTWEAPFARLRVFLVQLGAAALR
ncbi:hypothetical protein OPT61_g7583 [Boeremia exigua]|uniref:Uncharacterized protein n=1 Tax=Boeremia exigua TaxID=749465 RepID=A0ACC2I2Q3_9PLEO|nr:hypothetical protein OPT61_g7583 [Boeremia exigua]